MHFFHAAIVVEAIAHLCCFFVELLLHSVSICPKIGCCARSPAVGGGMWFSLVISVASFMMTSVHSFCVSPPARCTNDAVAVAPPASCGPSSDCGPTPGGALPSG